MIERHITFNVHPDRTADFEQFFAERYGPAVAGAPGNIRIDLLVELDQPTRYQMSFRWVDADAAVAWRTAPVHEALQPDLGALVSSSEIVGYRVIA